MQNKFSITLLIAIVLLTTIVSAVDFTVTQPGTFEQGMSEVTFRVTNTDTSSLTVTLPSTITLDGENGHTEDFSRSGATTISAGGYETFTITNDSDIDYSKFYLGRTYSEDFVVAEYGNLTNNETVTFNLESSYCEYGVIEGDLEITSFSVENVRGFGQEDDEWYPLDLIEVEVKVKNDGDDDISDVTIEWCLYNAEDDNCIMDDEEKSFKVKDGKKETKLISFQLDPDDIDEAVDDYTFYLKVYSDDTDYGEDVMCLEESEDITVIRDSFVILDNIQIPETAACGEDVQVTADIWNIGDGDEDDVYVTIYNRDLNIDEKIEIGDIDELDNDDLFFSFTVPEDTDEKRYTLLLRVFDEDDDLFESDDDDEAEFTKSFEVSGNCVPIVTADADITAILETAEEDVRAGKEIVIRATVKNTGEERTTYTIGVDGNELFSTTKSITPSSLSLDEGKSGSVLITLKLNSDAQGEQLFNINALFDSEEVSQAVSLSIAESGFSLTGLAIKENLKENWLIWVIVLINIILIIAIITVAVKMSRS